MTDLALGLIDEEVAPGGGYFDQVARRAATETALSLVTTYFVAGSAWDLEARPTVAPSASDDDLAQFVRMRVALAAARRLEPILHRVLANPSFYYGRETTESIGSLSGPLDVGRYLRTRLRHEAPRRYPIQVIRRHYVTPENTAACYGASWIAAELSRAPLHLIPRTSPEATEVASRRTRFAQLLRQPVLLETLSTAHDTRRASRLPGLLSEAMDRLDTGRIAAREPYRELFEWFTTFDPDRATAEPGSMEWAFYDERFDTKLFEIWSLQLLGEALTERLGPPLSPMAPLYRRSAGPLLEWHFGSAKVRLYYQASLAQLSVTGQVHWHYEAGADGDLRGFPDLAVEIQGLGEARKIVLIDPKLRQRFSVPTEEIYKLLGYFGNLKANQPALGAIVYYRPQDVSHYRLDDDRDGTIYAIGVDPLDLPNSRIEFARLASLVLQTTGISETLVARLRAAASNADADAAEETSAAIRQGAVVDAMLNAAKAIPEPSLAPIRKTTEAQLSALWPDLSADTQTMLVTAEYFGATAPNDADHSGPLLGLAASCERLLYERLLNLLIAARPGILEAEATLGTVIRWLTDACRRQPRYPEGRFIQTEMLTGQYGSLSKLCQTTSDLRRLNVDYRIPAAHREVVTQQLWMSGRSVVLDPGTGLLARLSQALTAAATWSENP